MANTTIKAAQIVQAAILLLNRKIVLPRLFWRQPDAKFIGSLDDTITLKIPAVRTAKTRVMRSGTALVGASLAETKVPVKLDTHVYDLLPISDEELTLDFVEFVAQVLNPQMTGVAEGMEGVLAAALVAGNFDANPVDFTEGTDEPYDVLVDAGVALNKLNVPMSDRVALVGANVGGAILKSDKLSKVNESGSPDALRNAVITRVAGFNVVSSNAVDPDFAWAGHKTAVAFGNVAPALPDGATMKARMATEGLALRYIRDYDPTGDDGPADRSLVDAFIGAASVEEGETGSETNRRGVLINFNDHLSGS